MSLRQLGFSLEEIRDCLGLADDSLEKVLELHMARLTDQVERGRALRDRLDRILAHLRSNGEVTVDQFIQTIEATTMNKYYTPEQLEQLEQRSAEVGAERIREVEQEWKDLFEALRVAMDAGTDPASEPVQELARKSQSLIEEFTGGDAGFTRSLGAMYQAEGPGLLDNHAWDACRAGRLGLHGQGRERVEVHVIMDGPYREHVGRTGNTWVVQGTRGWV